MLAALIWGGLAAASLLIGFALAGRGLSHRTIGLIMGVGSGALIAAIAYELVPESALGAPGVGLAAIAGALTFYVGDWLVDRRGGAHRTDIAGGEPGGSGAAIFVGTLLDNIPESLVLGMSLTAGGVINVAFLVAVFVSNLPEGVAGTINLQNAGRSRSQVLRMWLLLVAISAICAALGFLAIQVLPGADGLRARAFAAGAMLTMLADAMMPEAFEHGGKSVGLATALGFLVTAALSLLQYP